jgi:hypothetical protein
MLEEYRQFRDAADVFRELEEKGRRTYPRLAPAKGVPLPPGLQGVTLDTLLQAVQEAMARQPPEPDEGVLEIEPVNVEEKIEEVSQALTRRRGRLRSPQPAHESSDRRDFDVPRRITHQVDVAPAKASASAVSATEDWDTRRLDLERAQTSAFEERFEVAPHAASLATNQANGGAASGLRDEPIEVGCRSGIEPHLCDVGW